MDQRLSLLFKKAKYEPTTSLNENIWSKIVARNKRVAQIKLWSFSTLGAFSLVGLIPALNMLTKDLSQSGFYEYFSLVFSDGILMLSYWKEFSLSLAESLPVMSTVFAFSLLFVFFLSLRYAMRQVNQSSIGALSLSI